MSDFVDTPSLTFKILSDAQSLAALNDTSSLTFKILSAVQSLAALLSPTSLTVRFRPNITNGLLFDEVISAVWNESAMIFLNPELLAPVWNEETVVSDAMFGFPGISSRIQRVESDIEIQ